MLKNAIAQANELVIASASKIVVRPVPTNRSVSGYQADAISPENWLLTAAAEPLRPQPVTNMYEQKM